ncbi:hypothetical protein PFUM301597_00860 [Pseudomonas fluorescens]
MFGIKAGFERGAEAILQATLRVVARQLSLAGLRLPKRQLALEGTRMGLQLLRPLLVAAGLGRQCSLAISLLQVFEQDAPGHAVDCQVMDHQQQALGAIGHLHQGCAQQRALLQVQAALGFITQRSQFSVGAEVGLPHC